MELDWLQSLIVGLFSGLTDILPVSSQAHQTLLLTFFGGDSLSPMIRIAIHGAALITLLISCRGQIGRIRRQVRLTRMPRRRRTRMLDMTSIMDAKILRTAVWPILVCLLLYGTTSRLQGNLIWLASASLLNAVILYLPNMFPTADKDSRLVTPSESMQMGIGVGAAVLPGISSVGASYSAGILHGVDRGYMIHLTLIMHMTYLVGMVVYDILDIMALGALAVSGSMALCCGLAAGSAAFGTAMGVRILQSVAPRHGLTAFSFYSFGVALFTFILYLMV